MSRFLSTSYQALRAYTPGEQPTDRSYVKLNTNESPFPPSPAVIKAVSRGAVEELRLYPDPTCGALRGAIAQKYGVSPSQVFVSNGSDDILNFSFMAFCAGEGQSVVFPDISYGFYEVYAQLHGASYRKIPLAKDFSICPEDYCGVGSSVVIANPNAPTGLALSVEEIESIVASNPDHVVLIDEAYVDFGAESALSLVDRYENLLVVRTFSKSCSLAGARLGFAIGNEALIADLEKIKYSTNPYNINRISLLCGVAAMEEWPYYERNCRVIERNRNDTAAALRERGFTLTDSKANFLFAASPDVGGEELYSGLKERGVLVRHFTGERIREYNRITVGTAEEMEAFLRAVDEILTEKKKGDDK